MGQLNFDRFGDKPLKIIEQSEIRIEDQQKQNNITIERSHQNIKIPQGSFYIHRDKNIQEFRSKLPIYMKEQQIIQTINHNLVTLICGETGSGKSTQLCQFLLEKNYYSFGKIGITQPRRLATLALARRVSQQLNFKLGGEVGYQIRHQKKQCPKGLIKFMTDGILLNQMNSNFLLSQYSVIIIDEAHERKVNTDILIGLLSKLILIRYEMSLSGKCFPLRLIIMSATMRISDFQQQRLFNFKVPLVNVQSRMFPVSIFHQKNTPQDYIQSAVNKCVKIHRRLPPGDVLIFLTGKEQIKKMSIMLQQALQRQNIDQEIQQEQEQIIQRQDHLTMKSYSIYMLYSSLPTDQQEKIFQEEPQGSRKFIISTNIAETSITIPNIKYVVDSGQEKHKYFDKVWKWRKGWGTKAMAEQRAGRAGRTTHGYCYRLYSTALYANIMEQFPLPEISKMPLEHILLQIKSIGIENIFCFPFPTLPQKNKMLEAINKLLELGALQGELMCQEKETTHVTQLGKVLSFIPMDPHLGKMLLVGRKQSVQKYILYMILLLTVQSIFRQDFNIQSLKRQLEGQILKNREIQQRKQKKNTFKTRYLKYMSKTNQADIFTSINIIGQLFTILSKQAPKKSVQYLINCFANKQFLNNNVLRQLYLNADQICQIYQTLVNDKINLSIYNKPTQNQQNILLDVLLCSFIGNTCNLDQKNKYHNKNNQILYIHYLSPIYMKDILFVGCTQFFDSGHGRKYMRYPFKIKNYQLLAQHGKIFQPKEFIWRNSHLVGKTNGIIYNWNIPNLTVENPQSQLKYYQMSKLILNGTVIPQMKVLKKYMNSPQAIIKPDNLTYKVQKLVAQIKNNKIDNKIKLIKCFQNDIQFLKKQLQLWLNINNYQQIYKKIRQSILSNNI